MFFNNDKGEIIGSKVTHFAPVLYIRNDIVGNATEFSEGLIFYKKYPKEWQVIHAENIKKITNFNKRMWS